MATPHRSRWYVQHPTSTHLLAVTVVAGTSDEDSADDEVFPDLGPQPERTWLAAVPYVASALLAWLAAAVCEYQLQTMDVQDRSVSQQALRRTTFGILTQACLYVGLGLFIVGVLVVALRQHEHWRRESSSWLGDALDRDDLAVDGDRGA